MGISFISGLTYRLQKPVILFSVILFGFLVQSRAQDSRLKSMHLAESKILGRGEVIIRFQKPDGLSLDEITEMMSIDNFDGDSITAYANEQEFNHFLLLDIPFRVMAPPSPKIGIRTKITEAAWDWREHYPSYGDYIRLMNQFVTDHPDLCALKEIGTSLEGRKILVLKISDNPEIHEQEPVVLYTSSIHGDEVVGYNLMLRLIDYLLTDYSTGAQAKWLVDNLEIYINPLSNPDGTFHDSDTSVAGAVRFNSNGVDLNRNYPDIRKNSWNIDQIQPDNQKMMAFMSQIRPVLSVNFHGGAEVVNYPWDTWDYVHADDVWFRKLARAYADTAHKYGTTGYMTDLENGITNGYSWYPVFGGRQDYVTRTLHGREVTIELSENKMPDENALDGFWTENRMSLLQYLGSALTGVTGEITDSLTGKPMRAYVSIEGHDFDSSCVVSDAGDGTYYRLTLAGNYNMVYSALGYQSRVMPASVKENELTRLDIRLQPLVALNVYPDPFVDKLHVYIAGEGEDLILELIDLSGKKVYQVKQTVTSAGTQDIPIDKRLAQGVYIARLRYGKLTHSQKIVKTTN
jgi:hypothetical protein